MNKPLVILCASGHGRVVADAAQVGGHRIAGFLDPMVSSDHRCDDPPILGDDGLLDDRQFVVGHDFIVATGI